MAERLGLPEATLEGAARPRGGALGFAWRCRFNARTRKALARAADAFDRQPWRHEQQRWEEVLRPELVMQGMRLAATVPTQLADGELAGFLERCLAYVAEALETAAALGLAGGVVHADFARACADWARADTAEIAAMFPPEGTLRAGARHELAALREALADQPPEALPVTGGEPEAVLLELAGRPNLLGRAVRAYLERVRLRVYLPLDVVSPTVWEAPAPVLELLDEMVRNLGRAAVSSGASRHIAAVRERVPRPERGGFEAMVAEARSVQRLMEEPVHMTLAWSLGVARQALLHAGDRLVRHQRLPAADLIFEVLPEELAPLLLSGNGPDAATLRGRRQRPPAPASVPPAVPVEWLPLRTRRVAAAARAYIATAAG